MQPTLEADGPHAREQRRHVHVSLAVLFGVLWLLASFHLLVLLRHEIWPAGWPAIVMSAVPPSVPIFALAWGKYGTAALFAVPALAVAIAWRAAARRPDARGWLVLARCAVVTYWLFYDFVMGAFS
jgi:hypothetical protein